MSSMLIPCAVAQDAEDEQEQPLLVAKPLAPPNPEVDKQSIQAVLDDLHTASNKHNLDGIIRHYAKEFVSGDNLTLAETKKLIEETWTMFPDIQYESQIQNIRINGDWATVESLDTATAKAKGDPAVSGKSGQLVSHSKGLMYLHRVGKEWEIQSDLTLFESATITYGPLDTLGIDLDVPEQTFSGEPYSAKVSVEDLPPGVLAIATITKEPLVYPQVKPVDKFRTLSSEQGSLERIFNANNTNNNELVTATIGLTKIGQDTEDRPTIDLEGIATVVKRVNVVPKSVYQLQSNADELVRVSADGSIKVDPTAAVPDVGDEPETEGTPIEP